MRNQAQSSISLLLCCSCLSALFVLHPVCCLLRASPRLGVHRASLCFVVLGSDPIVLSASDARRSRAGRRCAPALHPLRAL